MLYKSHKLVCCVLQKVGAQELIIVVPHRTDFGWLTYACQWQCFECALPNNYVTNPVMPNPLCSCDNSLLWSMVWNAEDKSKRAKTTASCLSIAPRMSLWTHTRDMSVLWCFLQYPGDTVVIVMAYNCSTTNFRWTRTNCPNDASRFHLPWHILSKSHLAPCASVMPATEVIAENKP